MPRIWSSSARRLRNGLLFISPWLIGFLGYTVYPLIASFYYSFTDCNILQSPSWVGLANYRELLTESALFWTSLKNTLYMVVFGLPPSLMLSLFLAVLLNQNIRAKSFFRTLFYIPSILPAVSTAMLWMWVFNPQYGLFNSILDLFGVTGPGWLTDPRWAKPSFIIMGLWGVGGTMVIFLAGLQSIPKEYYEAALIDGGTPWRQFRHITLPLLTPTILYNLIMGMIGAFQYFTAPYIMSRGVGSNMAPGSPLNSTLFYSIQLFQTGFYEFKMGIASAMAWILFILIALATFLTFKSSARWAYYEGKE